MASLLARNIREVISPNGRAVATDELTLFAMGVQYSPLGTNEFVYSFSIIWLKARSSYIRIAHCTKGFEGWIHGRLERRCMGHESIHHPSVREEAVGTLMLVVPHLPGSAEIRG